MYVQPVLVALDHQLLSALSIASSKAGGLQLGFGRQSQIGTAPMFELLNHSG
jgi:hypothetical protein